MVITATVAVADALPIGTPLAERLEFPRACFQLILLNSYCYQHKQNVPQAGMAGTSAYPRLTDITALVLAAGGELPLTISRLHL
jgi:hypothetical protein